MKKRFSVWHRQPVRGYRHLGTFDADELEKANALMRRTVVELGGEAQLFPLGPGAAVRRWATYPELA